MNKAYIIWSSSGSYDSSYKGIHKIYADESVANAECDRLNLELKVKRDRLIQLENSTEGCDCWKEDRYCSKCEEYTDLQNEIDEQWDYIVEGVDVE